MQVSIATAVPRTCNTRDLRVGHVTYGDPENSLFASCGKHVFETTVQPAL